MSFFITYITDAHHTNMFFFFNHSYLTNITFTFTLLTVEKCRAVQVQCLTLHDVLARWSFVRLQGSITTPSSLVWMVLLSFCCSAYLSSILQARQLVFLSNVCIWKLCWLAVALSGLMLDLEEQ